MYLWAHDASGVVYPVTTTKVRIATTLFMIMPLWALQQDTADRSLHSIGLSVTREAEISAATRSMIG